MKWRIGLNEGKDCDETMTVTDTKRKCNEHVRLTCKRVSFSIVFIQLIPIRLSPSEVTSLQFSSVAQMSGTASINQAAACLALLLMASIASASVNRFHAQPNGTHLSLENQNISVVNNGTWSGMRNLTIISLRGNIIEVWFDIIIIIIIIEVFFEKLLYYQMSSIQFPCILLFDRV